MSAFDALEGPVTTLMSACLGILLESQAGRHVQTDRHWDMTCKYNGVSVLHL